MGKDRGGSGAQERPARRAPTADDWHPIETAPKGGVRILGWIVYRGELEYSPDPFERISVMTWDDGCDNPGWEREPGWHKEWIGAPVAWRPIEGPDGRLEVDGAGQ